MRFAAAFVLLAGIAPAAPVSIRVEPSSRDLRGAGAEQQFLAIAVDAAGGEHDVTSEATWSSNGAAAQVSAQGLVQSESDGAVTLTATLGPLTARANVRITEAGARREFAFGRDIGGVLTRAGCNNSNCHGGVKGRGGFKLSNGALHPKDDYEWIVNGGVYQVLTSEVKGERISRIDLASPEKSLVLRKASGQTPHGGGLRFASESPEYAALLDWVRKGAPYGPEDDTSVRVEALEVFPKALFLERGEKHRLIVTARLAGGRTEDFTRSAVFASNDRGVASASADGTITASSSGETSVLVRAAGAVASVTVGVIGPPSASYPDTPPANFIDEFIFDKLRRFRVPPSALSNDAEFLRRVCLDLTGTLPPPERTREFLASRDPAKRRKLIDALIASPEFVEYWTYRFDDLFRVAVFSNGIIAKWSQMYGEWVRASVAANKPYDQMARERLTAQGYDGPTRHYLPYDVIGPPGETMAEEVRVFFGRRLDCAQCHNHPYEAWSQDQFWGMAAFFGRLFKMGDQGNEYVIFDHPNGQGMGNGDVDGSIALNHPRTKAVLKPTLLDGRVVEASDGENPRKALADWLVKHPYFAEAAVNRFWSYFFGRGIVDPVDDFRSTNPPTHPELLARLAEDFRTHNHDLRRLIRTIVLSRTYQLSGEPNGANRDDRTNYSHSQARPLDAEVLLDAVTSVTGVPETFITGVSDSAKASGQAPSGTRAIALREPDLFYSRFLEVYGRPNRLTLPERNPAANLGQALNMLAGSVYNNKLDAPGSRLRVLLDAGSTNEEIVEEFYLAAFARVPDAEEKAALAALVGSGPERLASLKNMVWAILCSREFAENH
ncbi:MAG: DUF1553 domain-containing protein [Bryobacteraceae bacterium]